MSSSPDRIQWSVLITYSSLAFPLAAAFLTLQVIIPTFYAQVTGLTLSAIGVILLAARLWDTFTDPIVGYLSDKTPQKYGRRKIWILLSAPLVCLSVWALFNPPADAGISYLLIWTFAIYVFGTFTIVPLNAWGAELSPAYNERSRVTGARVFFGMIGTLTALIVVAIFAGDAQSSDSADVGNLQNTLFVLTVLVIVSLLLTTSLAYFFVPDDNEVYVPKASFKAAFALLKQPSPFRTLILSFLINGIGSAVPATLFLFYVTHVMQAPDKVGVFLFIYFICAGLSTPVWVQLAKRFGKHQVWSAAMIIGCCFFAIVPFIDASHLWLFAIVVIGTGFATGADLTLPSAINGDLIEWDALENGHKRPGLFFALWGTTTKLAYAAAVGIAFPLLDVFGFDANAVNTTEALTALAWMYGLPCVLCKLTAVALMFNYPINQAAHEAIRAQLADKNIT